MSQNDTTPSPSPDARPWPADAARRFRYFTARCQPDPVTGCWNWTRGRSVWDKHRAAGVAPYKALAELLAGCEVPAELQVRHLCDNNECVNPGHLAFGTATENHRDNRGRLSKLTEAQWNTVFAKIERGEVQREVAEEFGVTSSAITQMRKRRERHAENHKAPYTEANLVNGDRGVFGEAPGGD